MNPAPSLYSSSTFCIFKFLKNTLNPAPLIRCGMNSKKVLDSDVFKMSQIRSIIKDGLEEKYSLNKGEGAG